MNFKINLRDLITLNTCVFAIIASVQLTAQPSEQRLTFNEKQYSINYLLFEKFSENQCDLLGMGGSSILEKNNAYIENSALFLDNTSFIKFPNEVNLKNEENFEIVLSFRINRVYHSKSQMKFYWYKASDNWGPRLWFYKDDVHLMMSDHSTLATIQDIAMEDFMTEEFHQLKIRKTSDVYYIYLDNAILLRSVCTKFPFSSSEKYDISFFFSGAVVEIDQMYVARLVELEGSTVN